MTTIDGALTKRRGGIAIGLLLVAIGSTDVRAQVAPRVLPVGDAGWEISGDVIAGEHLGRRAFALRTGRAIWRDLAVADGTIDLAMAFSGHRSFAYVQFRMQGDGEHEEIYLRPHKSRLPDAVQYCPVFHGESQWQLYHGPGATAAVELPVGAFVPVRIVLAGRRAALFVGDLSTPVMVMPRLGREPSAGYLALRAFTPQDGAPEGQPTVWMTEVTVRTGEVAYDFAGVAEPPPPPPGSILAWEVSAPFVPESVPLAALPAGGFVAAGTMQAEPSGRIELHRRFARPRKAAPAAVWLRATLRATTAGTRQLRLGYSDQATVFLDGRPIAAGDARYSFDAPRQDGLLALSQLLVFLPLDVGEHELLIGLADGFGGMGLAAQLVESADVEVMGKVPP